MGINKLKLLQAKADGLNYESFELSYENEKFFCYVFYFDEKIKNESLLDRGYYWRFRDLFPGARIRGPYEIDRPCKTFYTIMNSYER